MIPIAVTLLEAGLPALANAVLGMTREAAEEYLREKTGATIDLSSIGGDQLTRLKGAEAIEQNRHSEEVFRLEIEDKKDARAMQVEAQKSEDWLTRHFIHILAVLLIGGGMVYMGSVMGGATDNYHDLVIQLFSVIVGYFFGSSLGSNQKTKLLSKKQDDLDYSVY